MNTNEITTILGKGSAFEGKLTFEGAVRIDGEFSGEIRTEGTLIIGESAEVRAQIHAAKVVVEGVVRGDMTASQAIELHAPARVYGNLATPSLEIEKGSVFEGASRMDETGEDKAARLTNGKGLVEAATAPEPVAEA